MNLIDRFTRDDVSAKVWWPVAMLIVVLFVLTFPAQGRDAGRAHDDAQGLAVRIVRDVIDPAAAGAGVSGPIAPEVAASVQATIADDVLEEIPAVDSVRLWARDGRLLFSTDPADEIGSGAAVNDRRIQAALADPSSVVSLETDVGLTGEPAAASFEVYRALGSDPAIAAQVDFDDEALLRAVSTRWVAWRIALGVMGVLTLALAGLSVREPLAPSGAGVKFYPASIPTGTAVVDADDAAVLQQSGVHARRRVHEMQARVEELELDKVRLEGELQRALSGRAMAVPGAVTAIPRPSPSPEPDVIRIPEPPASVRAAPVVAATPADQVDEPVLEIPPEEPAAIDEPETVEPQEPFAPPRRRSRARIPEPIPEPEPEPTMREDPPSPVIIPEPARATPARRPDDAWAASSRPVVRVPEAGGPDSDRDVLDVLERLVEPVSTGERSEDAASDMRVRLARTAAAKKPGSRSDERFEHPDRG